MDNGQKPDKSKSALGLQYYANQLEYNRYLRTARTRRQHLNPDSVYVFSVGKNWSPGAWQKVVDMVDYTLEQGITCWFHEINDSLCQIPYMEIPAMRNAACQTAKDAGFEWVMMVDNDVLPEPDLLVRLLDSDRPVIVPYIKTADGYSLASPQYTVGGGTGAVRWAVLSCILIHCNVLNCFGDNMPFTDVTEEGDFFRRLWHYGHQGFQNTSVVLEMASSPNRPGKLKNWDELQNFLRRADSNRRKEPNRRPIDINDPNQEDGIYTTPRFRSQVEAPVT
jgi:hypothetical protein|tara:strand:+ start:6703 stop:7539 length:837 start_codon:yes stop_codon:yes gene_type:complete